MKTVLMNKFGTTLGIVVCAIAIGVTTQLPSCSLTTEQRQKLQAISVPAAGIISKAAISQGWLQPGDEITMQRGVAVVFSPDDAETKIFKLAEIGIDRALEAGAVKPGDTITVDTPDQVTISTPVTGVGVLTAPTVGVEAEHGAEAKETLPDILPPAGG